MFGAELAQQTLVKGEQRRTEGVRGSRAASPQAAHSRNYIDGSSDLCTVIIAFHLIIWLGHLYITEPIDSRAPLRQIISGRLPRPAAISS